MALDPGGASGAARYRPKPPALPRVPSSSQPGAGLVSPPTYLPRPFSSMNRSWDDRFAPQTFPKRRQGSHNNSYETSLDPAQMQLQQQMIDLYQQGHQNQTSRLAKFQAGVLSGLDPQSYVDSAQAMYNDPVGTMQAMPANMKHAVTTPEGLGSLVPAAATGGAAGGAMLLPFKMNFKMPKSPGTRVKDYPMMDSSRWRMKNRDMGAHYGFAGRLGNPEDRAAVQRQRAAPTIQEHLANLDALQGAQSGGVIPQGLRDLMNNSAEGNLQGMAQFGARQDRSVAPIHMRERVAAGDYPGLRNPPTRKPPTNKGKRLSAEEGNDLGRMLGELDEWGDPIDDVFPGTQHSLNFLSSRFTGAPASLVERQGINQSRARGSFMDESRRFTPELLADMLGRSGMWRVQ